jgi:4'-phosphopantetheinyl transferase
MHCAWNVDRCKCIMLPLSQPGHTRLFAFAPAIDLMLGPTDLHVWQSRLDLPEPAFARFALLLSTDEQARADRMRIAGRRQAFMVARATLRIILGAYLGVPPVVIRLTYNRFGKPFLAPDGKWDRPCRGRSASVVDGLEFSVAHAGDVAVYALARHRVGIDVERLRPDLDHLGLARHFFAAIEQQTLSGLPVELQPAAFLNCWTRKEAYAKACGMGLYLPFEQFAVSCIPGAPAELLAVSADAPVAATKPGEWRFWELSLEDGYVGVVAVESPASNLACRKFIYSEIDED